jgi:hypothetical protein
MKHYKQLTSEQMVCKGVDRSDRGTGAMGGRQAQSPATQSDWIQGQGQSHPAHLTSITQNCTLFLNPPIYY